MTSIKTSLALFTRDLPLVKTEEALLKQRTGKLIYRFIGHYGGRVRHIGITLEGEALKAVLEEWMACVQKLSNEEIAHGLSLVRSGASKYSGTVPTPAQFLELCMGSYRYQTPPPPPDDGKKTKLSLISKAKLKKEFGFKRWKKHEILMCAQVNNIELTDEDVEEIYQAQF